MRLLRELRSAALCRSNGSPGVEGLRYQPEGRVGSTFVRLLPGSRAVRSPFLGVWQVRGAGAGRRPLGTTVTARKFAVSPCSVKCLNASPLGEIPT